MRSSIDVLARRPRLAALTAAVIGFGVTFGIASAIGAASDEPAPQEHKSDDPVTERVVVASGKTPGRIGRWRLLSATDAQGDPCVEVQLLDEGIPASVPESARIDRGFEGIIGGGCGGPAGLDVVTVVQDDETLVLGGAPDKADRVDIKGLGQAARSVRALEGPSRKRFFATRLAGKVDNLSVVAKDSNGQTVDTQNFPPAGG